MNDTASKPHAPLRLPLRLAGWASLLALLSLPAVLRFPWTTSDFVIMGLLLLSVGLSVEFLMRRSGNVLIRLGFIVAVLAAFLTVWVNLAVGMIGDDNAYNLLFSLPLAAMVVGGVTTRWAPSGAAKAALAASMLQAGVALGGYGLDPRGAVLSTCFGLLWLLAAVLFRTGDSRSDR